MHNQPLFDIQEEKEEEEEEALVMMKEWKWSLLPCLLPPFS